MFVENDLSNSNDELKERESHSNLINKKNENNFFNRYSTSIGSSFDLLDNKEINNNNNNLNFKSNSFFNNDFNRNNNLEGNNYLEEENSVKNKIKNGASKAKNYLKNSIKNTIIKLPETINKLSSPFLPNQENFDNNNIEDNFLNDNYSLISRPSNVFGINSNSLNKELNNKIDINEYNLSVFISDYEIKYFENKELIYFKINLYSNLSKKEWTLFRKYREFYEMNLIFQKYYTTVPNFPSTSISKLNDPKNTLDKLNKYIKEICNRPDLLTSIYCVKFLRLENHYKDIQLYYPLELYDLHDELILPISCGYFLENANLLFIGCGKAYDSIFSGITNKIKNLSFFKKKNNEKDKKVLGQIVIFNIIKNYQDIYHFEVLYAKPTYSECTSINYYKDKNCLCVGMNDGTVNLYKIFINENTKESQGQFIIEAGNFKAYNNKIIGTIINFIDGYIYTISNESYIKIFDLNYQTFIKECLITIKNISSMLFDDKFNKVFLGDEGGNIYIIDLFSNPIEPKIIIKFTVPSQTMITTIYYNVDNNILIIGVKYGKAIFYKINNYEEKKYNKKVEVNKIKEMNISYNVIINKIILTERGEMLFALNNGSVNVYYDNDTIPEFVIDAHLKSISDMFFEEKRKSLITLSEDKSLKMVKLPVYYPDQMLKNEKYEKKNIDNSMEKLFGLNPKNNNNEDLDSENDYDNNNENNCKFTNIFNKDTKELNINNNKKIKIRNKDDPLTEEEIWSLDLDGWSLNSK